MVNRIRLSVGILSGILLLGTSFSGMAEPKSVMSETLKTCMESCKSEKDATAYESCALKCNAAEKKLKSGK